MGLCCLKKTQEISNLEEHQEEIKLISYISNSDQYYQLQENNYNYLKKIHFQDFLYSLVNFSIENATSEEDYSKSNVEFSMNDSFFNEDFPKDYFQSFVENKILNHKMLFDEMNNNNIVTSIFRDWLLNTNNALVLKLTQNANQNGDENADENSIVKKKDIIPIGILYCNGYNFIKIKAIYNIFQQDDALKSSKNFSDFLLSLFIVASYGMVSARNKLKKYDEIGDIENEKLKELLETSELKDCQHLVEVVNKLIFGEDLSKSYNYEEFKKRFKDKNKGTSLAFLLSPPGVRFMLQKNNV